MALKILCRDPSDPAATPAPLAMAGDRLTVGRGAGNDLVLPDPDRFLSKRHCVLERRGTDYVLLDVSTNGTFLNFRPDRLGETPVPLSHGDVILVGGFELVVEITATIASPKPADLPPLATPRGPITATLSLPHAAPAAAMDDPFLDDLLDLPGAAAAPAGASQPDHSPAERDHFAPPRAQAETIPDDWEVSVIAPLPAAETTAPPRPRAAPGGDAGLRAFLDGIGAPGMDIPADEVPEIMARLGRTMGAMIEGMREILMARAALKSEMRLARTMIRAEANNPLKFSVSAEQAVTAMIRPPTTGYQQPEAAVAEALRDIKAHEIATITGMEAALKDLLARFCPDALSERIAQGSGMAALLGSRKARLWEAFEQHYARIARETEDDFQSTFGREFARAYDDQIKKL